MTKAALPRRPSSVRPCRTSCDRHSRIPDWRDERGELRASLAEATDCSSGPPVAGVPDTCGQEGVDWYEDLSRSEHPAVARTPRRTPSVWLLPRIRLGRRHIRADEGATRLWLYHRLRGRRRPKPSSRTSRRSSSLSFSERTRISWSGSGSECTVGIRGVRRVGLRLRGSPALDIASGTCGEGCGPSALQALGSRFDRIPAYGSGGYPMYPVEELIR